MNTDHASPSAVRYPPLGAVARPRLRGGTLLLVEDSRLSCESIRLMLRGLGGRLRRAETLQTAKRHLALYTPDAALIDLGLPDGSGLDLIAQIDRKTPRVPLVLAISGQPELETQALDAGADGFLAKPFASVQAFRRQLAPIFPRFAQEGCADHPPPHDTGALRDDLYQALDLLLGNRPPDQRAYALQFVTTLARNLADTGLLQAVQQVGRDDDIASLAIALRDRLRALPLV